MTYAHFERLSAVDAAFLAVEDERAHMHIGSVNVFEPGPLATEGGGIDIDRIRGHIAALLHRIPRFRQKLAYVPLAQAPVWIDDRSFHLDYHVRHTALPHPGDVRQLERLASRIMSQHLDRRRPLWELWVAEGLEAGRFALIAKIHHAIADGISGVGLLGNIIGRNPDYRPPPAPAWFPLPAPGARALLEGELRHRIRSARDLLLRGVEPGAGGSADAPREPLADRLREAASALADAVEAAPSTPLNMDVGPNRRFAWMLTGLDRLGEIRKAAGGTLNDVVLAIVSGAIREFLLRRGSSVSGLDFRAMVPVSVRLGSEQGQLGNRISQLLVQLPIDTEDPTLRLRIVCERTRELKRSGQSREGQALTAFLGLLPPRISAGLARMAARRSFGNMVITNVPGAPWTTYLLGARLLETYPLVPLSPRQCLNVAVLSYDGFLHWGVNADYDAVPDASDFVALLCEEVERLHKEAPMRATRPSAADEGLAHAS